MTWLQVDGVTMEMLKTLNMATLPGVILQATPPGGANLGVKPQTGGFPSGPRKNY